MTPSAPRSAAVSVIVVLVVLLVPLVCLAGGNPFGKARFDFSEYRPEPAPDDLVTVYHLIPAGDSEPQYHASVCALGVIVGGEKGRIPGASGYYFSRSKYHPAAVRLTLFARDLHAAGEVDAWVRGLEKDKRVTLVPYVYRKPEKLRLSKDYQGEEQEFRRYLAAYTPVCIECMASDFEGAMRQWTGLMENGGMDVTFLERSAYFMGLTYPQRSAFVESLFTRTWTHMAVNFVLGYDR